jgi:hypothetical protein
MSLVELVFLGLTVGVTVLLGSYPALLVFKVFRGNR